MLDNVTAIQASYPVKSARGTVDHAVEIILDPSLAPATSIVAVTLQGGSSRELTSVSTSAGLAIGTTAQRIKNGNLFYYQINGTNYSLAAGAAAGVVLTHVRGTAFTGTITGSKYGGLNVYVDASGNIRVLPPADPVNFVTVQAYDTAAACLAALVLVETPSAFCKIGMVTIAAAGGGFTFGTTALTGVDTYYNAQCPYYDLETYNMDATDLTAQRAYFIKTGVYAEYIRVFLSALTGSGVTVKYNPVEIM